MRLSTLSLATIALVASFASANALPPVRAGILQCQGGQNVGFVVGSVTSLECVFQSEVAVPSPISQPCAGSVWTLVSPIRRDFPGR